MTTHFIRKSVVWLIVAGIIVCPSLGIFPQADRSYALQPFVTPNCLAVSGHQLGATAAYKILHQGGNAIDAMVAMYATIALVKPDMAGPFGGGWALIYMARTGEVVALDMDSAAPAAASPQGIRDAFSKMGWTGPRTPAGPLCRGPLAIGVGGTLKGWEAMLDRYGTMTFAEVLKPAIEYGEKGWIADTRASKRVSHFMNELSIYPGWLETYGVNGRAPKRGERIYNKNLANTYKKIAALGADVMYKGEIAKEVDRFFKEVGGWITTEDLANYNVVWSKPLKSTYTSADGTDYTLYGNQPPSSSIEIMETLNILDGYDLKKMGHNTVEYLHTLIEASKLAHLDNYRYVGDPAFVDVPVEMMLSEKHARELRAKIHQNRVNQIKSYPIYPTGKKSASGAPPPIRSALISTDRVGATTHSVVVDRNGNIVSMTNTNGCIWGSGVVIGNTGMLGNDGMDWMDIEKSPWTNKKSSCAIAPGKRNRWTLCPVIVFKNGKPFMALGGAGAETTAQGVVQPFLNVVEFGMNMQKAVEAPRFRWGDILHYEGGTDIWLDVRWEHMEISDTVRKGLVDKGHKVVPVENAGLNPLVGLTNAILIQPEAGGLEAGFGHRPGQVNWAFGD